MYAEGEKMDETDLRLQCLSERHPQLQGTSSGNVIVDEALGSRSDKLRVKVIFQS